jgi:thiosulfate/3-mercaptopyruvate sulfurtransferase
MPFPRVIAAAALAIAPFACAASGLIVDAAYVQEAQKRGAIVWDTRAETDYRKGHIAGAVNVGDVGAVLRDPNSEDFIAHERIAKLLGDAGIDPEKEIVVYHGRGNPNGYFGLWTLQYFGAARPRVYHGGIDDWRARSLPLATEPARLPAVAVTLRPNPGLAVTTKEMIARLKDPGVQILDVRTPKEYSGEDIRALRGGHIPGAVNIPYEQNWVDPEAPAKLARRQVQHTLGLELKSPLELRALYAKLDPGKETIVYCQSGVRAAETATVLSELGFRRVRIYDSSWLGYGNTLGAPAANETFFNVGALNARVAGMQRRIEELERALAEQRKPEARQ